MFDHIITIIIINNKHHSEQKNNKTTNNVLVTMTVYKYNKMNMILAMTCHDDRILLEVHQMWFSAIKTAISGESLSNGLMTHGTQSEASGIQMV
jgi:hypothetical protein